MNNALELRNISKAYGATKALTDVSLVIPTGTVHAVLGENGAGKSTLVKILTGAVTPDGGSINLENRDVAVGKMSDARAAGIITVFQELSLIPDLTVVENVLIDNAPRTKLGWFSGSAQAKEARKWLAKVGLPDLPLSARIRDLSLPVQQLVEIAKALSRHPKILILDEATASLNAEAVADLFSLIRSLRDEGMTMIFISHRMNEIDQIADNVTVLRNGRLIETFPARTKTHHEVCSLLAGREVSQVFPEKRDPPSKTEVVLKVSGLKADPRLNDASFDLRKGEILGIGGLEGHGQKDLLMTLFGVIRPSGGQIELFGEPFCPCEPFDAAQSMGGLLLLPEDRKSEGLLLPESVHSNIVLSALAGTPGLFRNTAREKQITDAAIETLSIKVGSVDHPVGSLSGGNQQKVLLARLLALSPQVLLLVDPTRGIDVGTKQEIYRLMRELAEAGVSIAFLTTDYEELVGLCDRVLIMYEGRLNAELSGDEITEAAVLEYSLGLGGKTVSAA